MSDFDKPADQPQPPAQAPLQSPDAKPEPRPGPPPSLEDDRFDPGRRLSSLDPDAIERELQEAMGGLSEKDMYGEPARQQRPQAPAEPAQRRKGRVLSVRGPDVFVDVPGERSQGVLPVAQFPQGPPAVGTEVEFTVEGYDEENGLLT